MAELEAELKSGSAELLELRKQQSLAGLDQREMVAEIEARVAAEAADERTRLESALVEARGRADTTEAALTSATAQLATLTGERDGAKERVTQLLQQKDELNEKLREQASARETFRDQLATRDAEVAKCTAEVEALGQRLAEAREQHEHFVATATGALERGDKERLAESATSFEEQAKQLLAQVDAEKKQVEMLKQQHKREQDLMVAAWYDLGQQYSYLKTETAGQSRGGRTYLGAQRQRALRNPTGK